MRRSPWYLRNLAGISEFSLVSPTGMSVWYGPEQGDSGKNVWCDVIRYLVGISESAHTALEDHRSFDFWYQKVLELTAVGGLR